MSLDFMRDIKITKESVNGIMLGSKQRVRKYIVKNIINSNIIDGRI